MDQDKFDDREKDARAYSETVYVIHVLHHVSGDACRRVDRRSSQRAGTSPAANPTTPCQQIEMAQNPLNILVLLTADCPAPPKSIDPLEPCAYHPALEFDKTLSIDVRGTAGKTEIE